MLTLNEFLEKPHREFKEIEDVFNPGNRLSGYICLESTKYYGALWLTEINGMQCKEQLILSAPKMHYPYNRNEKFYFYNTLEVSPAYQKYDGTAIIAYAYEFKGKVFRTFKTRMTAIAQSFEMYDFVGMWKEMIEKYPEVINLPSEELTIVFELYGIRNKHLIIYPIELNAVVLFGINRKTEQIVLPEDVGTKQVPAAGKYYDIKPEHNFEDFYKRIRGELESTNKVTDFGIEGSEGSVIYVKDFELGWIQWKCKPESVMAVHMKPGLSRKDILTTCYNALENVSLEELNYEFVKELLMEEVTDREVDSRKTLVLKCIEEVKEEVYIRNTLIKRYKEFGVSLKEDKVKVMRFMSQHYPKNRMTYVYAILSALDGKEN